MGKIPIHIESIRGHDTLEVPEDKVQETVTEQLKQDKWATVEKKDGSTEMLTKADIPAEEEEEEKNDWKNTFNGIPKKLQEPTPDIKTKDPGKAPSTGKADKTKEYAEKFEGVESVTCTNKAKGG